MRKKCVGQSYRARYYDSNIGRFISEDPVHFEGGIDFYLYAKNEPTVFVDPTGLKSSCCPSKEEKDIQNAANHARRRLYQLKTFGHIPPNEGVVDAVTGCSSIRIKGTNIELESVYNMTIDIDPKKHPCIYDCVLMHEMVHARMCQKLGATKFGALNEYQTEYPAYFIELGCYLKEQMESGTGPYRQ